MSRGHQTLYAHAQALAKRMLPHYHITLHLRSPEGSKG